MSPPGLIFCANIKLMIIIFMLMLGLCFGSFVEATSWRLHEQDTEKKRSKKQVRDLSIVHGRSMCASCKHQLAWYDLLPLVSWLSVGGKCRYCRKAIGWHAPALEIGTAALFAVSYLNWPYRLANTSVAGIALFGLWLALLVGFVLLAVYDLQWMLLPDRVVFPLQAVALVFAGLSVVATHVGLRGILDASLAVCVLAGLFWALYQLSDGAWIGGGDVKLGVVLGLVVGTPLKAGLVLFIASLLGSIVGIPAMVIGKQGRQTKLPFGPFLIIATVLVVLFGSVWIAWYKARFFAV